jgi:glycosyltransferase involved in cell wall biosynthesis
MVASRRGDAPSSELIDGIRVYRVPIGATDWIGFSFRAAGKVKELRRVTSFDVVHFLDLHFAYAYSGSYIATLVQPFRQRLQARGRLPYYRSFSNLVFRYIYYTIAGLTLERWAARRVIMILATSQAVRDAYVRDHPTEAERIAVVPEGIDVVQYQRRDSRQLRARLGLEGKRLLLYVGFSTPRKGLEYLGPALDELGDDCCLLIVGKWEAGYRDRFYRSLSSQGRDKVIEVGYVPDDQMPGYYSLADVFVLPSLFEGFGLPLAEAMACRVPIVATRVGSIPEVVGDAGILVPPMDSSALASALQRLVADEGLRTTLGARGVERAQRIYNRDIMVARTLEVYQSYVEQGQAPAS